MSWGIVFIFISKIQYDDWFQLIRNISYHWYVIIFIIFFLFYYINYFKKGKHIKASCIIIPKYGFMRIDLIKYAGLNWEVNIPREGNRAAFYNYFTYENRRITKDDINIEPTPLCIKCECEIESKQTIFFYYKFKCPKCKHTKRSFKSLSEIQSIVLKLARNKYTF